MQEVKNKNIRIRNPRSFTGLLILLFFAINCSSTFAQVELNFNKWQSLQKDKVLFAFTKQQNQLPFHSFEKRNTSFKSAQNFTVRRLPEVYEYRELGFFCKLDLSLDKTMNMPFRFRLGNLEYVNKLEGYWK